MCTSIYTALVGVRKEMRLVRILPQKDPAATISCQLEVVSLLQKPNYQALSYCWGAPSEGQVIRLQGHEVNVTTNLFAALSQFRLQEERPMLWIDAICINQSDIEERSQQVGMMREIYENAASVRVWLGPATSTTGREFSLIERLLQEDIATSGRKVWQSAAEYYQETPQSASDWYDLVRFFQNVYWHRTWTIQERVVANKLTLHSGESEVDVPNIAALVSKLSDFTNHCNRLLLQLGRLEVPPFPRERVRRMTEFKAESRSFIPIMGNHVVYRFGINNRYQFSALLAYIGRTGVTDPKDHVYGTLGLFPELNITPDYNKTVEEVYTDFAVRAMQVGKTFHGLYFPSPPDSSFPSWAPDLNSNVPPGTAFPLESYTLVRDVFDASLKTEFRVSRSPQGALVVPALLVDRVAPLPAKYQNSPLINEGREALDREYLKACCLGVVPRANTSGQFRKWHNEDFIVYNVIWRAMRQGQTLSAQHTLCLRHFSQMRADKKMLFTVGKAFGSAQTHVQARVGDYVAVLASLEFPLLLRPIQGQQAYRVLGPCYLNDVMLGEAVLAAANGDEARKNEVFTDINLV